MIRKKERIIYLKEPYWFLGYNKNYYRKRRREICLEYLGIDVDKYRGELFQYVERNGKFLFV